jgi:phosphate transport system protein
MTRQDFDLHLQKLQGELIGLAGMVERAIELSTQALENRDMALARQVIEDDLKINHKRYDIEEQCIELIATQQPLARDLRIILAVLNMIVDLERIGDHAEGNAKIAILLGDEPPLKPLIDIPRMAAKTVEMIHSAMDAFVRADAGAAKRVIADDDIVDALYDRVFEGLLKLMVAGPDIAGRGTRLIWAAHNLERSADRVTNICERIIFVVTGEIEEKGVSRD